MKSRRALVVLLSLLLLAAQHAVFAHGLTHWGKPPPPKEHLTHSNLCAKCVSFEKLAHAIADRSTSAVPIGLSFQQPPGARCFYRPRQVAAFNSRAPPALL